MTRPDQTMHEHAAHPRRWWVLAVLCVVLLVVVLDNTILNVALPTIQESLHASQSAQEWMVDSYTLVFAGLLFSFGVLGDRIGRKKMLMAGLAVFGLASAASAWAGSPGVLIVTRGLMGIGGAAIMPTTLSIITNAFDSSERGRAIGIWAGISGMAIAVGPITGGALLSAGFWWGSVFLVNVPIVIVGLIAIALIVPESSDPQPKRVDPAGVVLSIGGLIALVYGIIHGGQHGKWGAPLTFVPLVGGLVLLALFVLVERRSDHPSLDVSLFRNPAFSAASAAITLVFFGLFGATFYLTFYLQFDRGYSPLQAGVRLLPVAVAILVFAPRSAKLAKRFGPKAVVAVGLLLVTAAFSSYQFIHTHTTIWALEALLFVQGVGMANVMAPATESIMSTLPRERAGAGSAVNNTVRQVGGALGVAILGSVLSSTYRHAITPTLAKLPLPTGLKATMAESIGATKTVLDQAPPQLADRAKAIYPSMHHSYIHAMHMTSLGSAGVALLGCVIVLAWLPGKGYAGRDSAAEPYGDQRRGAHRRTAESRS